MYQQGHVPIHLAIPKAAALQSMSAELKQIDQQIAEHYTNVSMVETTARQLEERISRIPGAKKHLPQRSYGSPVDIQKIKSNLTLSGLIARDCPQLSAFCGIDPSIHHRMQEQELARDEAKARMNAQVDELRTQNQEAQQRRERLSNNGINPNTGRRWGVC